MGAGAGHFVGGFESMRTWSDWQAHNAPIALGGIEIPGASRQFGKKIDVHSRDVGGLAQYENGSLSLGFYSGVTFGSGRVRRRSVRHTQLECLSIGTSSMSENWVMLVTGVLLIVFGLAMTAVSGPMPGARPLYPPSLRLRLILIGFGLLMFVLGLARLIQK